MLAKKNKLYFKLPKIPNSTPELPKMNFIYKKFGKKHIYRAGAIVWVRFRGKDYYCVIRSLTRPARGIQLPGGKIERDESPSVAVVREVEEETGILTKIVAPLGIVYLDRPDGSYSNVQMYYVLKPLYPMNVFERWRHMDMDKNHQDLECWFVSTEKPLEYLALGQSGVVEMFQEYLKEQALRQETIQNLGVQVSTIKLFRK
jgi:ADP-ribose pyrophosphatase YjhB (NUDIX family)